MEELVTERIHDELSKINKEINLEEDSMEDFLTSDALHDYLIYIGQFPLLTKSEVKELFETYSLSHDEEIKKKIMCSNLRLVVSIAKRYFKYSMDPLDLIQEGNIGLMVAIDKFDIKKGYRFSTYATYWILHYIIRSINRNGKTIRTSIHTSEILRKINTTSEYMFLVLGREPSIEEISKQTGISEKEIQKALVHNYLTVSFSKPLIEGEEAILLEDVIRDPDTNVEEDVENSMLPCFLFSIMHQNLKERDLQIVALRWGLFDGEIHTLQYVSEYFNISKERVRQIEERVFQKLKEDATLKNYFMGTTPSTKLETINFLDEESTSLLKQEMYQRMLTSSKEKKEEPSSVKSLKR